MHIVIVEVDGPCLKSAQASHVGAHETHRALLVCHRLETRRLRYRAGKPKVAQYVVGSRWAVHNVAGFYIFVHQLQSVHHSHTVTKLAVQLL